MAQVCPRPRVGCARHKSPSAALHTAIERGEVPAWVDPVSRAKGLVASAMGLMVIGKANPDEGVLRAVVDNAFADLS